MLPTKGYFQDIECPFNNSGCGRPYCHFRHRKKHAEIAEEAPNDGLKPTVPTYKPTPKSELAKSHIPISYVPDLAFRTERVVRPLPKIERPTYKPTPLSILSSANKKEIPVSDSDENHETIKDIKETIASNEYDPNKSEINFEELSNEFDLIDEIIKDDKVEEEPAKTVVKVEETEKNEIEPKVKSCGEKKHKESSEKKKSDSGSDKKHKEKEKSSEKRHSKERSGGDKKKSESKHEKSSEKVNKHKSGSEKSEKCNKPKEKSSKNHEKPSRSSSKEKPKQKPEKDPKTKEKHRKEEKKDSREKNKEKTNKPKHKSHGKSRSRSRDREKPKKPNDRDKNKKKPDVKPKTDKKPKKRSPSPTDSISFSDTSSERNISPLPDFDIDIEDEDETLQECYKIFNEYKPEPVIIKNLPPVPDPTEPDDCLNSRKRTAHVNVEYIPTPQSKLAVSKPKILPTPGQTLANRYKIAKLTQGSREQECIMREIEELKQTTKRPAPTLLEAAREHKIKKTMATNKKSSLIDDIINGTSKSNSNKVQIKKIAAVPNVALIQKAKERISHVKANSVQNPVKTIAQSQKQTRVAHVPEFTLSDIPDVLNCDKSKLPVNVRTRFLTLIAEECIKLYAMKEEAYQRALNEEFSCYEKCKVLTTYRNSAMLAVHKLRKEIQERESKGLGLIGVGEPSEADKTSDFKGRRFYDHVRKWILSEPDLDAHGYPKESGERGVATILNKKELNYGNYDDTYRKCARCGKIYQVDDDGWPLYDEECMYHPLKKRTIRREQVYLCCKSSDDMGCVTSDSHVTDGHLQQQLEGFQTTMDPESDDDPRNFAVYALDCEMCYTTKGLELTRVTIVDTDCKTVYESLVKPLNPIIDYNTRFSGITKEQMDKTSTSILQIQANILHLCNSRTILIGHSLESDMKALKIVHSTVIDTSVLFPHKMGLPHKRALKALASEYLKKIIQNDVSGHDSAEDAITCMELVKWKLKEEMKLPKKN